MAKPKKPARRGRNPLPETERKDRLVQTRVPEDLDTTLRQEASKKRVSVSQLIRNVLEDTFDLVDNVVAETAHLTQAVKRDAKRIAASAQGLTRADGATPRDDAPSAQAAPKLLAKVYAWQEVVLNRDARCARCGTSLKKGEKGLFGLHDEQATVKLWLCLSCRVEL